MAGELRKDIHPGLEVEIVQKADQRTDRRTRGIVRDILTSSPQHPHGIKVRLQTGEVGRVKGIIGTKAGPKAGPKTPG
ncbi:MAG TPA: YwbE family protein [Thermoanaerobaculia bacterium]|nr:YwbE family protein [Thermoanaerobaculia bacterium]